MSNKTQYRITQDDNVYVVQAYDDQGEAWNHVKSFMTEKEACEFCAARIEFVDQLEEEEKRHTVHSIGEY